jgi:L-histidine N-alpha-methyltransferase
VSTPVSTVRVDVHFGPAERAEQLRTEVREGLLAAPKWLSPKWFYDDRGSMLFDEITRLPEYYLTRREREILDVRSGAVAAATGADTLVELGSGTSEKTRLLLDALADAGTLRRFVPFDVSEATLRASAGAIADEYPGTEVHAVVGDFQRDLGKLPDGASTRLVAFLGSSIGNLGPLERARFLAALARVLRPGEWFLCGFDLVKDRARLEAAYNDAAGVTAQFNRNVLRVVNHELGADFEPERFEHVAVFDDTNEWIEMRLRSSERQTARIAELSLDVAFEAGEEMRTEISAKFRRAKVESELAAARFDLAEWWTDSAGEFALALARRA